MTGGLIYTGRIWRFTYTDDSQGGAVPTGTVIYLNVFARIVPQKPTLALLEQGLETPAIFSAMIAPGDKIALKNNDQFENTGPNISPYLGQKFVIVSDPAASMLDGRKYWKVFMRKFEVAHSNNLQ